MGLVKTYHLAFLKTIKIGNIFAITGLLCKTGILSRLSSFGSVLDFIVYTIMWPLRCLPSDSPIWVPSDFLSWLTGALPVSFITVQCPALVLGMAGCADESCFADGGSERWGAETQNDIFWHRLFLILFCLPESQIVKTEERAPRDPLVQPPHLTVKMWTRSFRKTHFRGFSK